MYFLRITISANGMLELDDIDDEEFDLDHPSNRGDTLTYFAINDTSEDGTRWISIGLFNLINIYLK